MNDKEKLKGLTEEERQCLHRKFDFTEKDKKDLESSGFKKWIEYKRIWEQFGIIIETENIPEIEKYIKNIGKQAGLKEDTLSLAQEVQEWVMNTKGLFLSSEIYRDLGISTRNEKKNVSMILSRLCDEQVIKREGNRNGCFRLINKHVEELNWENASTEGIKIYLPFDLHEMANIFYGNIITINGRKSAGKTAFCLEAAKLNRNFFKVNYITSEMWESELKSRLDMHKDMTVSEWKKIRFSNRSSDVADVIEKDMLNIVDYLELRQERTFEIGDKLAEIHEKLSGTGVAIVACQLDPNKEIARGGPSCLDKPRLILTLRHKTIKIYDAKNFKGKQNPSGKIHHFDLVDGAKFIPHGTWHDEEECTDASCGKYCKDK